MPFVAYKIFKEIVPEGPEHYILNYFWLQVPQGSVWKHEEKWQNMLRKAATFLLRSGGCSFLWNKLDGVSKGEAPVKAEISEAPMVCCLAFTQASLLCCSPVCRSFKKALKASTFAISGKDTKERCFSNWLSIRGRGVERR